MESVNFFLLLICPIIYIFITASQNEPDMISIAKTLTATAVMKFAEMKRAITFLTLCFIAVISVSAQAQNTIPLLKGPYLGQIVPGKTPVLFAPGIVSTGFSERDITISPDGKEIFFGMTTSKTVTIMYTNCLDGLWTEPEVAPFASDDRFFYFEPCFTPDGNRIFFLTTMPSAGNAPKPGWTYQNIFAVDRKPDGEWGEPYDPGSVINGDQLQFYPSVTSTNKIYFCRTDKATKRNAIFRSDYINDSFSVAEKLPPPVNTDSTNPYNVFVAPDESFLIACISEIPLEGNPGRANYFIFFHHPDDSWSYPLPLGPEINIKGSTAMSSSLSPDGKYLFFAAQINTKAKPEPGKPMTLSRFREVADSPQNGNSDIYWVDISVIDKIRPSK